MFSPVPVNDAICNGHSCGVLGKSCKLNEYPSYNNFSQSVTINWDGKLMDMATAMINQPILGKHVVYR